MVECCEWVGEVVGCLWFYGKGCLIIGLEMVDVFVDLGVDVEVLFVVVLYCVVCEG